MTLSKCFAEPLSMTVNARAAPRGIGPGPQVEAACSPARKRERAAEPRGGVSRSGEPLNPVMYPLMCQPYGDEVGVVVSGRDRQARSSPGVSCG